MEGCGPGCGYCGRCTAAWEADEAPDTCDECGDEGATVVVTVGRFCSVACLDKHEADRAAAVPAELKGVA